MEEHLEELATIESLDSGAVYTLALKVRKLQPFPILYLLSLLLLAVPAHAYTYTLVRTLTSKARKLYFLSLPKSGLDNHFSQVKCR